MNREHNGQEVLDEKLSATTTHEREKSKPVTGRRPSDVKQQIQVLAAGAVGPHTLPDTSAVSTGEEKEGLARAVSDDRPRSPCDDAPPRTTKTDPPSPTDDLDVPSPDTSYPEGGLRAWLVVLGAFSGMTASFGLMNTMGTFQPYISTHQLSHLPQSTIGWIFSVYVFAVFFCGVQIGPVFDAKGPRALIAGGSVCLVAGTLGLAESTELWHFILSFSIICGLGSSLIFTPAVSSIAHFFLTRRAFATGIATTGGSFGGVIFPLMLQSLFQSLGYKWATRLLALLFAILLLAANLLIRSRLPPSRITAKTFIPAPRIFLNPTFALTTAGVFFIEWALFIPLAYISSYALANGVPPAFSYQLLALLNTGSVFGRFAPGLLADRWGRFNTMIATVALCLLSVLALWLPCRHHDGSLIPLLVPFALLFGFASGSNISLVPVCVGQLCATEVFGQNFAALYTVVSLGALTGLPIGGAILGADPQAGGGYTGLIVFVAVTYAAGVMCFLWARVREVGWGVRAVF